MLARPRIHIRVGVVLEYLKISDTWDMTNNYCLLSLFWSVLKPGNMFFRLDFVVSEKTDSLDMF